jgi:hypothetical protein
LSFGELLSSSSLFFSFQDRFCFAGLAAAWGWGARGAEDIAVSLLKEERDVEPKKVAAENFQ